MELGLGLPELGQVEGGDLLRLLDLLLVGADLALQLVNQRLRMTHTRGENSQLFIIKEHLQVKIMDEDR